MIKILVLGDCYVGKTSLIERFIKNRYNPNEYDIIGIDFKIKEINIENKLIKVQIWDFKILDRFIPFPIRSSYKKANGIILIYSKINKKSFERIEELMEQIELNALNDARKILMGSKCDDNDLMEVTEEEGKKLADEFGMNFFETSAKTGYNVNEAFNCLIHEIIKNKKNLNESKIKIKKAEKKDINYKKRKCNN